MGLTTRGRVARKPKNKFRPRVEIQPKVKEPILEDLFLDRTFFEEFIESEVEAIKRDLRESGLL
jgi:hypothetical protein